MDPLVKLFHLRSRQVLLLKANQHRKSYSSKNRYYLPLVEFYDAFSVGQFAGILQVQYGQ